MVRIVTSAAFIWARLLAGISGSLENGFFSGYLKGADVSRG
jgi:hypothetical protein